MNLITNYYLDANENRQNELDFCLKKNIENQLIQKIILVMHPDLEDLPIMRSSDKILPVLIEERPTFKFFFDLANIYSNSGISIISNTDIHFDSTLRLLYDIQWNQDESPVALALSRMENGIMYAEKFSQDVWIFKGKILDMPVDFCMGKRGCDNRLIHELKMAGYSLYNPGQYIHCHHEHASGIRNYSRIGTEDLIPGPHEALPACEWKDLPKVIRSDRKRILHIGMHHDGNATLSEALASLGDYRRIDWKNMLPMGKNYIRYKVISECLEFQPDLVFMQIQTPDIIDANTIRQMCGVVVNFTGDVRMPIPKFYYDMGRECSLTLFTNVDNARQMMEDGISAGYLQMGFNHHIFTPKGEIESKDIDIVFFGNNYSGVFELSDYRLQMVMALKDKYNERFHLYGGGWPHGLSNGNLSNDPHAEAAIYRRSKIAINLSHFNLRRYSSDRIFRAMGSGCFTISHRYPGIELDFIPGIHLDVFENLNHLTDQIDRYLSDDQSRYKIRKEGCNLVHDRYKWEHRINRLKEFIGWK